VRTTLAVQVRSFRESGCSPRLRWLYFSACGSRCFSTLMTCVGRERVFSDGRRVAFRGVLTPVHIVEHLPDSQQRHWSIDCLSTDAIHSAYRLDASTSAVEDRQPVMSKKTRPTRTRTRTRPILQGQGQVLNSQENWKKYQDNSSSTTIRYDTISIRWIKLWYNSVYLTCRKKLTGIARLR